MNKSHAQRQHAKSRCKERYGEELNGEKYRKLVAYIVEGKREYLDGTRVNFISRQSRRVSKFQIITQDAEYIVVFDKIRKNIITFLWAEDEYQARLEAC